MIDRKVSAGCVIAYALWAIALAVWGMAWVLHVRPLGDLSIIVSGAAATATVRTYFVGHLQRMKTAMAVTSVVGEVTPLRADR